MKNALNNQVGMLGDMFLWLLANLKQGVIYFIKQALPPNISAGSVVVLIFSNEPAENKSNKYLKLNLLHDQIDARDIKKQSKNDNKVNKSK